MSKKNANKNEEIKEAVEEVVEEVKETEETAEVAEEASEEDGKKEKKPLDVYNICLLVMDYIFIIASYVTSLMLISELDYIWATVYYLNIVVMVTPFYALFCSIVFFVFKLYSDTPAHVGVKDARRIMVATFFTVVVYGFVMDLMGYDFPHAFYVIAGLLQFFMTLLTRFYKKLTHFSNNEN